MTCVYLRDCAGNEFGDDGAASLALGLQSGPQNLLTLLQLSSKRGAPYFVGAGDTQQLFA